MRSKKLIFLTLASSVFAIHASAEIKERPFEYHDGSQNLEGVIVEDVAVKGIRPAVLIVHDWMGISDDTKQRAHMLAEMGYVAFAADIYGKGVRPKDASEAMNLAKTYKADQALMRSRATAALQVLQSNIAVDRSKIAVIGYCFGGTVALELARSGAPLAGVVTFHGGLATSSPNDAKNIKGKILVLHGADDPYVNADEVKAFEDEMRAGGVDWQLTKYSGAVHAFTIKNAGDDNSKGAAYNERADKRSWQAMKDFFAEIFKSPSS
jgi:dienelactone hydrolase